ALPRPDGGGELPDLPLAGRAGEAAAAVGRGDPRHLPRGEGADAAARALPLRRAEEDGGDRAGDDALAVDPAARRALRGPRAGGGHAADRGGEEDQGAEHLGADRRVEPGQRDPRRRPVVRHRPRRDNLPGRPKEDLREAGRDEHHPRMKSVKLASFVCLIGLYTVVAWRVQRPDLLPLPQDVASTLVTLIAGPQAPAPMPAMEGHHHHHSDQIDTLMQEGITLPASLLISFGRTMFGLAAGLPVGILIGLWMGWSRRADDYLHPIFVLVRSVPPLALITYIMLWLGHSEAHRLIPIVYAVATTAVIPTYHGVRDVA